MKKLSSPFLLILLFAMLCCLGKAIAHEKTAVVPFFSEKLMDPFAPVTPATRIPGSNYRAGPLGFTVIDTITGLEWLLPNFDKMDFEEASNYCTSLNWILEGDYHSWRLPTVWELRSIVDFGEQNPATNPSAFSGAHAISGNASFWASRGSKGGGIVYFSDGRSSQSGTPQYVQCVRGGRTYDSNGPYQINTIGTVTDVGTGLVWQGTGDQLERTHSEALAYCAQLPLDGGGWRLPNVKELLSIVDLRLQEPAIDTTAFPGTQTDSQYWSATPYVVDNSRAWTVIFSTGTTFIRELQKGNLVRCVK